jgi:hypothetical protein
MARGLGRIQLECLRVIALYEVAGKRPTTDDIAAVIFSSARNTLGYSMPSSDQLISTARALSALRRRKLVTGEEGIAEGGDRAFVWSTVRSDAAK